MQAKASLQFLLSAIFAVSYYLSPLQPVKGISNSVNYGQTWGVFKYDWLCKHYLSLWSLIHTQSSSRVSTDAICLQANPIYIFLTLPWLQGTVGSYYNYIWLNVHLCIIFYGMWTIYGKWTRFIYRYIWEACNDGIKHHVCFSRALTTLHSVI